MIFNATENRPLEVVKTGSGFSPMPLGSVKEVCEVRTQGFRVYSLEP